MKYKGLLVSISVLTTSLGLCVATGWVFDIPILRLEMKPHIVMVLNTAILLMLSGCILYLSYIGKFEKLSLSLILIVLTVSLLSFLQNALKVDLGIDELFIKDTLGRLNHAAFPGRMSALTSFCFVLINISFLAISTRLLKTAGQFLLHFVTLISLIVLVGYTFDVPKVYSLSFLTTMALPTALAIFVYSIGASLLNPDLGITGFLLGNQIGNVIARLLFPSSIIGVILISVLRSQLHQRGLVDVEFGNALFAIAFILIALLLILIMVPRINKIDLKRTQAELELKKSNENLEAIVLQRTADLQTAVDKLKESELKLSKSELLFKGVFSNTDSLMLIKDLDGKYLSCNNQFSAYYNISSEDLKGKSVYDLLDKAEADRIYAIESALLQGAESHVYEMALSTAFGRRIFHTNKFTLRNENNVIYALADVSTDITELRTAEANLRAIFNTSLVSIISTDLLGNITNFNKGAEMILGYTADEAIGKLNVASIHVADEINARRKQLTEEWESEVDGFDILLGKARQGKYELQEWTYVRKDGTRFPVELLTAAIHDDTENTIGFLGIATDISDLKKAKSELENLAHQLQRKNTQLLGFSRLISHNLRSPVNNLKTLLSFYSQSTDEKKREIYFEKFADIINHLSITFNELMHSLKIQEDITKEREVLSFQSAFDNAKSALAGSIIESDATITADFTRAAEIHYPKSYLESIFLNLLSNSIKYRAPGRKTQIHFQSDNSNGQITLKAKDNGVGIDMSKYGNLLFGLNHTFHDNADAAGVGLYITKTQVEAMGGTISAESEVDQGTTMTIVFNKNQ